MKLARRFLTSSQLHLASCVVLVDDLTGCAHNMGKGTANEEQQHTSESQRERKREREEGRVLHQEDKIPIEAGQEYTAHFQSLFVVVLISDFSIHYRHYLLSLPERAGWLSIYSKYPIKHVSASQRREDPGHSQEGPEARPRLGNGRPQRSRGCGFAVLLGSTVGRCVVSVW